MARRPQPEAGCPAQRPGASTCTGTAGVRSSTSARPAISGTACGRTSRESRDFDPKTARLVTELRDLEYIVTGSEYEAFILESNLVHEHQPRYNYYLKDDKSFPFIRITLKDLSANQPDPVAGPGTARATSARTSPPSRARLLIDTVRRTFGIRHCRKEIDGTSSRPCCRLPHQTLPGAVRGRPVQPRAVPGGGECGDPVLEGRDRDLRRCLEADMNRAAASCGSRMPRGCGTGSRRSRH